MSNYDLTGSAVQIVEVECLNTDFLADWKNGPAPFNFSTSANQEIKGDIDNSARYLSKRVHQALYDPSLRQWNRIEQAIIEMIPLVSRGDEYDIVTHLAVIHVGLLACRNVEEVLTQLDSVTSDILTKIDVNCRGRSYSLVCLLNMNFPALNIGSNVNLGFDQQRALLAWQISTFRPEDEPPIGELERLFTSRQLLEPTSDMTLLVHHDGASLVLSDEPDDEGNAPFGSWLECGFPQPTVSAQVQWHLHTTLTDSILLGMLQRLSLNTLANRIANATTKTPDVNTMTSLQSAFGNFKGSLWWRHVSEEETVNLVLQAFRARHGLDDLFTEVDDALNQYSEHLQGISAALSSAAVTILTLTLFPLTVTVALITALVPGSADSVVKIIAYLCSVPISLATGFAVAALIPGYLAFLRSTFKSRNK
jgi:hypothetical protein